MKIIENTETTLLVDHNPRLYRWFAWACSAAVFFDVCTSSSPGFSLTERGLALVAGFAGLAAGVWLFPQITARFDRKAQQVAIRETRLTGYSETVYPLADVEAALASEGGGEHAGMQSLSLIVGRKAVRLELGSVAQDGKAIRDRINAWLHSEA